MDDFYTSMYEVGIIDSQETSNQGSSSSNVIYSADALVPLNPSRWTAFTAGSAAASDMPDLTGKYYIYRKSKYKKIFKSRINY